MKKNNKEALAEYQKAVALQYDGLHAPEVTATGQGDVAKQIIELAIANNVPIYENPELTQLLSLLELGDEIPHELYVVMAQIIALAYNIKTEVNSDDPI